MKEIEDLVRKENIDCELTFTRSLDMYLDEDQLKKARVFYDSLIGQGLDFMDDVKYLSESEAQKVSSSFHAIRQPIQLSLTMYTKKKEAYVRDAKGGFSFPTGHLWPYKLITGLIRIAVANGLNLQTNTPVSEISQSQNPDGSWSVSTNRGTIHARKIILATNAFTSALAPEYSKAIVPCKGVCTQIVAAPNAPHQELPGTYAIRLGPGAYIYQISRKDGSLIVGGASHTFRHDLSEWYNNPDDGTLIRNMEHYFDGYMQRTFFGWEDSGAEVKHIWSGGMYSLESARLCFDLTCANCCV
jgi:glycine/D-amino acid oxidase-like deaminating enzyme